jgi:hypothetical protein
MTTDLLRRFSNRSRVAEGAALVLSTLACIGMYFATDAPLYNPVGTIDPWLYTALWTNFDQIYHYFLGTYYASRLPWIAPGYALNLLFDQRTAYFIAHIAFFFAGAILFYLVCRRWFGVIPALAVYVGLIGNQMYFNEHRWDYETGGALTFVIASIAFAIPTTSSRRRRSISLALSGFFGTAAVTTLIIDSAFLAAGLPVLYVAALLGVDRSARLARLALDFIAFAAGALLLVVGGGIFTKWHDGDEFLFFMPQLRAVFSTNSEGYQQPVGDWFPRDPYFFFPIFVVLLALVVLLVARPAAGSTRRMLIAASIWTAAVFGGMALWEFGSTGFLFEYSYYFSTFLVPTLFTLAAVIAVVLEPRAGREPWGPAVFVLSAVAVLGTGLWIYRSDSPERIASDVTDGAYLTVLVAMVIANALVALWGALRIPALGAIALAVAFFGVTFGADASYGTSVFGHSDRRTGGLYEIGSQMTDYLHENGFKDEMPFFWYDSAYDGGIYASLQSLYYFGYTYVGLNLPRVDQDFRSRMSLYQPSRLVLLCTEARCSNAPSALARAGYPTELVRRRLFREDPVHVWVAIYRLKPAAPAS